jgi:cell division protein FtsZ
MPGAPVSELMTTDEELRVAADALEESVLVVGVGEAGKAAATEVADRDVPATDDAATPDAAVYAVDGAAPDGLDLPDVIEDVPVSVAIVTLSGRPASDERAFLDALADRVGTVVVAPKHGPDALADAVTAFVSIVRDSGFVNIDLADARTLLADVNRAALGIGTSGEGSPVAAVDMGFASLPAGIETDPATGVLVDLLGGPEMSVEDVSNAVTAVRGRVGPDAHVIWGGAVDPTLEEAVRVRLVVAGVGSARVTAGDPCPRCGAPLSAYTLGSTATVSCDDCGFAGVSARLRE